MKKIILVFVLASFLLAPRPAQAQTCENPFLAIPALLLWVENTYNSIVNWEETMKGWASGIFTTALYEVGMRTDEFEENTNDWMADWGQNRMKEAQKASTAQLYNARVKQTLNRGAFQDARVLNEMKRRKEREEIIARQRYKPSALSCQVDTAGPSASKGYLLARSMNRGFAMDSMPQRSNAVGSISANGRAAERNSLYQEYQRNFCNPMRGDQGCAARGTYAGKQKDLPAMLWGNKQTIDMSDPGNRFVVNAGLRTMIAPSSPDPVPKSAMGSSAAHEAILLRRAKEARLNTVYNVMGQMVGERVGGSGLNIQALRQAGGAPPTEASTNASYREIQNAMGKDRYNDPEYILRMVSTPEQVVREQGSINALRLQTISDIYKRQEEMLAMEAAAYSSDLDSQRPRSGMDSIPLP